MTLRTGFAIIGFVIGLSALALQFSLTVPARTSAGDTLAGAVIFYFTFFTILTNLMLVLIYLGELVPWRWLGWWRAPVTRAMMVGAIVLVMAFYHFVLAATWDPQGWFRVADVALHYVTPILYVVWWLTMAPHGALRIADLGPMVVPPAIYLVYVMIRGAIVTEYPYPILEAHVLGYQQVALNVVGVLAGLIVLFALAIAADRLLGRRRPAARS